MKTNNYKKLNKALIDDANKIMSKLGNPFHVDELTKMLDNNKKASYKALHELSLGGLLVDQKKEGVIKIDIEHTERIARLQESIVDWGKAIEDYKGRMKLIGEHKAIALKLKDQQKKLLDFILKTNRE